MRALDERVAIVTGAAAGVGFGIAQVLAAEGANVVIADLNRAAGERAVKQLDGDAIFVEVDVADPTCVDVLAAAALERWGRVDILGANAGVYPDVKIADVDDATFDRVMGINVRGAVHSIQAVLPAMHERGYGRIVLTSSITGPLVGDRGYSTYGASKAALLGLMRSVALEVSGDGITVNAVQPGNVNTPGFGALPQAQQDRLVGAIPLGRLAEPADVGWAVRYLASEEAAYITGQTLVVDGGQVLPES